MVFIGEFDLILFQVVSRLVGSQKPFHMFLIPLPEIWREMLGVSEVSGAGSTEEAGIPVVKESDMLAAEGAGGGIVGVAYGGLVAWGS